MKTVFMIAILAILMQGCSNGKNGQDGQNGANAPVDASILSSWINGPAAIPALDFSQVQLNVQMTADTVISCPIPASGDASGTPSPSGPVLQVAKGNLTISGSDTAGVIQFGALPHDHTETGECYVLGEEAYSYSIEGDTLTLCDLKYLVCSTFTKAD